MVETERAFAARATVVGWKQAFLEYFSDAAIGFDGEQTGSARDQLRQVPDPPRDMQLLWEPRFGDISANGELGWLTGPSTNINPARNNGTPRYGTYASVWKRQADGRYKVVLDVGITTPQPSPFASGFTAAGRPNRFTGDDGLDAQTSNQRLAAQDAELNTALLGGQTAAFRGHITSEVRLHRPGLLPITGSRAALAWLQGQPRYATANAQFAEAARSGDLGYTWGRYSLAATGGAVPEKGVYVRVWVRERRGSWKVALDVLQPQ